MRFNTRAFSGLALRVFQASACFIKGSCRSQALWKVLVKAHTVSMNNEFIVATVVLVVVVMIIMTIMKLTLGSLGKSCGKHMVSYQEKGKALDIKVPLTSVRLSLWSSLWRLGRSVKGLQGQSKTQRPLAQAFFQLLGQKFRQLPCNKESLVSPTPQFGP